MTRRFKMRKSHLVLLLSLLPCLVWTAQAQSSSEDSETLGSVKAKYLNQRVVIEDVLANLGSQGSVLLRWSTASDSKGRYEVDRLNPAPASDRGLAGTIIAIQ